MMTARLGPSLCVSHGTRPVLTIRKPTPGAGEVIFHFHVSVTELIPSNYATMRFNPEALHGANNGLHVARALMEEVKKEYPWISYGDLWTLAGVAAIQVIWCLFPYSAGPHCVYSLGSTRP